MQRCGRVRKRRCGSTRSLSHHHRARHRRAGHDSRLVGGMLRRHLLAAKVVDGVASALGLLSSFSASPRQLCFEADTQNEDRRELSASLEHSNSLERFRTDFTFCW